jgi:hypothetical protein
MNDHTSASVSILGMSKTTTADAIVTALGSTRSVARDIALIAWSTQSGHVAFDLPRQHHMAAVLAGARDREVPEGSDANHLLCRGVRYEANEYDVGIMVRRTKSMGNIGYGWVYEIHRDIQMPDADLGAGSVLRHRVQGIFVCRFVHKSSEEAPLSPQQTLRAVVLDQLSCVQYHLQSNLSVRGPQTARRRPLTILSESITDCSRCATQITVTSLFSSVRSDAWITASVS